MPDRYIAQSESEQQFGDLLQRVMTDPDFAARMERDPCGTLDEAGFELTDEDRKNLYAVDPQIGTLDDAVQFITKPVVKILTKGTKPAVRVATKGTKPAVSVAVNTVIAVKEPDGPDLKPEVDPFRETKLRNAKLRAGKSPKKSGKG